MSGRPPDTREPGHTAFAHLAENAIDKASPILEGLKELDASRARRVQHPAMQEAVGRSTNLLVSQLVCGQTNCLTRVPTECVVGASLTFPPNEELNDVEREVEQALGRLADADPWLAENRPRLEWLFGTQGVEVPEAHDLHQMVSRAVGRSPERRPRPIRFIPRATFETPCSWPIFPRWDWGRWPAISPRRGATTSSSGSRAALFRVFGPSELMVLAVYGLGAQLFGRQVGLLASLVFLGSHQYHYYHCARTGELIAALILFMTSAILLLWPALRRVGIRAIGRTIRR